jgi:hypothetical protein
MSAKNDLERLRRDNEVLIGNIKEIVTDSGNTERNKGDQQSRPDRENEEETVDRQMEPDRQNNESDVDPANGAGSTK